MTAHQEADGDNEDCVVNAPLWRHGVGDDASHHNGHEGQKAEHYVHGAVVAEGCM